MLPLGGDRDMAATRAIVWELWWIYFSAVLSGANYGPFVPPMVSFLPVLQESVGSGLGHFFGAMRVDAFMPAETFRKRMDHWIETMRGATPAAGHDRVLIPGDVERACEERSMIEGLTLLPQVVRDMEALAVHFSLDFHED
jgi:LDH2 family malate/lactate/ureidoglycolate dehydrogenase